MGCRVLRVARLALPCLLFLAPPARASDAGRPVYLSLGDSLATSTQPLPDGHHHRTSQGYSEYVWRHESKAYPGLRLVKLGHGGATSADVIHKRDRSGL